MNRLLATCGVLLLAGIGTAGAAPPAYRIETIGLADPEHRFPLDDTFIAFSSIIDANGGVWIGQAARFGALGDALGQDVWLQSAVGSAHVIGLTGPGYDFEREGELYRAGIAIGANAAGQAAGQTYRYEASGAYLGRDAWRWADGAAVVIGLTGSDYAWPAVPGEMFRESDAVAINAAGVVIGTSNRFAADGAELGVDAFRFDGDQTTLIGLTGAGYHYTTPGGIVRRGIARGLNDAGDIVGDADRFTPTGLSLGRDAWRSSDGQTQSIGLDGPGYSFPFVDGLYREASADAINAAGIVIGTSRRFSANGDDLGLDAWLHDGSSTTAIGLAGDDYDATTPDGVFRESRVTAINAHGDVVGSSQRLTAAGDSLGQDVWLRRAGTDSRTIAVNPIGAGFEFEGQRIADATGMNASGDVIGIATRFNDAGQLAGIVGWHYDVAAELTTPLDFSGDEAAFAYTSPRVLSDDGTVFGTYARYDGPTPVGESVFRWSAADGFADLGDLVVDSLDEAGWASLTSIDFIAGGILVGGGLTIDQAGGQSSFRLVPLSPGDANADGAVNFDDLLALAQHYGSPDARWSEGDFNRDGSISFDDLLALAQHYGQGGVDLDAFDAAFRADAEQAFGLVPEPASALFVIAMFCQRRRRVAGGTGMYSCLCRLRTAQGRVRPRATRRKPSRRAFSSSPFRQRPDRR